VAEKIALVVRGYPYYIDISLFMVWRQWKTSKLLKDYLRLLARAKLSKVQKEVRYEAKIKKRMRCTGVYIECVFLFLTK
jgi:hypothetical protein